MYSSESSETLSMEYSDEDEFLATDIDKTSGETSFHMLQYNIEKNDRDDIEGNLDVNAIKCENITIKDEIEPKYEYMLEIENKSCIDRNDHFDVKAIKCEELTIKSEIEDSSEDSRWGSQVEHRPSESVSNKHIDSNTDGVLHNFGKIVEKAQNSNLESIQSRKRWTKRSFCPYCNLEVTHFPRHLQRRHESEGAVREIFALRTDDPQRRKLLDFLRRQGNYALNSQMERTRPVRRPRNEESTANYLPCNFCLGFFKKRYLAKHKRKCKLNDTPRNGRTNHISESQAFHICSGQNREFYDSLRLKDEVLNKMRVDEISKTVMEDVLICSYGESRLRSHKRLQLTTMVSNQIRELGRLLIVLKRTTGVQQLIDVLKPEFYENIVTATKMISGYDEEKKNFKSPSLALHMSTRLNQVCDIATKLIIKKCRFINFQSSEVTLKKIKRLKELISSHFNSDISSIALKDLNEKQLENPKKKHKEYYRLPEDKFQTAKVSKVLIAINKGKGRQYKGKSLDETELSDIDSADSAHSLTGSSQEPNTLLAKCTMGIIQSEEESDTDPSSSTIDLPIKTKKRKASRREAWPQEQCRIVKQFFGKHIENKVAPKKHEVEEFKKKYPSLFHNRNWIAIKAYVYNSYRKKK